MARQSAHRSAAAPRLALLAAGLWLLLATAATPVALAQDAPPPDPPPAAGPAVTVDPLAGVRETVDALKEGFERLPERIASALWDMTVGRLAKLLLSVIGFFFALFGYLAGGAISGVNFFSQIPEPWVTLAALDGLRGRLLPVAARVGALAATLIVARWVAGAAFDWPFPGFKVAALAPLVAAAPAAMLALIRAGNALSAALFDPGSGLPGLANAESYDKAAGTGVAMLFYFVTLLWLWWVRVQIVLAALLLFATSPLAVACWALPFGTCHWIARAWLTTFIGTVAVQVLMALTLGIGVPASTEQKTALRRPVCWTQRAPSVAPRPLRERVQPGGGP
jgi:hypothetical protein